MTRPGAARTDQDRRTGSVRQRRFRERRRVRDETVAQLRDVLGHEPPPELVAATMESAMQAMGLTLRGAADGHESELTGAIEADALERLSPSRDHAEPDDGEGADRAAPGPAVAPSGKVLSFRQRAEAELPPDHPARRSLGQLERALAFASVSTELRIAADRDKIHAMLMRSAERGDVASILWLASRLAPAAKQRRAVHLPEIAALDLKSPGGVADAIDAVIRRTAAGEIDLGDAQTLLETLKRRQDAAEATARAAAYHEATEALKERNGPGGGGGLAARLKEIRARLAGADGPADDPIDVAPEPAAALETVG